MGMRTQLTREAPPEQRPSQCNTVQKGNPGMVTTARTIDTVIEDSLFPVLKEDSNIAQPTGQIGRPRLNNNPTSPRFKLFMKDLIPHPKISVSFDLRWLL
jgi:hypothetical protein